MCANGTVGTMSKRIDKKNFGNFADDTRILDSKAGDLIRRFSELTKQ
jgi:hypothetical protein